MRKRADDERRDGRGSRVDDPRGADARLAVAAVRGAERGASLGVELILQGEWTRTKNLRPDQIVTS